MPETTPEVMNLLARLEVLDGELRTLRRLGVYCLGFVVVMLGVLAWGVIRLQGRTGEMKDITVADENGKPRLWLGVRKGSPGLEFYDENQKVIGGLKMTPEERGLILLDENGHERATLGVAGGQPRLILYDKDGKQRAIVAEGPDGTGLLLKDPDEKTRAGLIDDQKGPHLLVLEDKKKEAPAKPGH